MSNKPKTLDLFVKATTLWSSGWLLADGQAVTHPPIESSEDLDNDHVSLVLQYPELYNMPQDVASVIEQDKTPDLALYNWMFGHGNIRFILSGTDAFFEVPQVDEHCLYQIKEFVLLHKLQIENVVVEGNFDKQSKEFKMADILTQLGKSK